MGGDVFILKQVSVFFNKETLSEGIFNTETNMTDSIQCSRCTATLNEEDIFCSVCGYPENGSQEEKDKYKYRIKLKKDVVTDAEKKLKNVKVLLMVIAGINLAFGIFYLTDEATFADGISSLIGTLVFLGCVAWVNKKPLMGVLAAFIFYILLQLSVVLVDPALLFQGILLKIVFIGIFVKGINSARDYEKFSEQLSEMNAN